MRFGREVAAARSVSGFFAAPMADAHVDGPVPWLATAYVAGPSVADAVRDHGPLPGASVLPLAAGLAEGLSAIHATGLVQRDLYVFSLGAVLAFAATGRGPFGTTSAIQACTTTPGIDIRHRRIRRVHLSTAGSSQPPGGNPSCTPATVYATHSSAFVAPRLTCWSLIARIGNGQPFEVGTSILVSATTGRLYLGVNDNSCSGNNGIRAVNIKIGALLCRAATEADDWFAQRPVLIPGPGGRPSRLPAPTHNNVAAGT